MLQGAPRLRAAALALALAGCLVADDDGEAETSSSTTTGAEGSTTTSSTSAVDESSTTGPPPGDGVLECTDTCTVPLDCCLPGTIGCPGAYPYNFDCLDGVCLRPYCLEDDECTTAGEVCREVRGVATCVLPCDVDPEACTPGGTACAGTTDDGLPFCFERCDAPGVSCGNQTCDAATGLCVCDNPNDCPSNQTCVD
jgi:hypothetical protein